MGFRYLGVGPDFGAGPLFAILFGAIQTRNKSHEIKYILVFQSVGIF